MISTAVKGVFGVALSIAAVPALADSYTQASFSGGVFGGNANVSSPFSGNGFAQGQTFNGTFVYDNNLVPANGTGFVNVYPASFPDVANIPPAMQFAFNFGPLVLTPNGADLYGIQYNNGQFNGFAYVNTFAFQGGNYQLNIQGGSLSVYQVVNGQADLSKSYVNGYINIGNGAVTNQTPYTPRPPVVGGAVPEPATWAMLIMGFGFMGGAMRYRRRQTTIAFT